MTGVAVPDLDKLQTYEASLALAPLIPLTPYRIISLSPYLLISLSPYLLSLQAPLSASTKNDVIMGLPPSLGGAYQALLKGV